MRRLALAVTLFLAACTGKPSLDDPALGSQELNLEEFFEGETVARGQFQDILGTVRRRFDVAINGEWDGRTLILTEDFVYEDGSTERRVWSLVKTGPDSWSGSAPGVLGIASGTEKGDAFNWKYTIDLPIPSAEGITETMRVSFDDWMWLVSDDRLLNRAYVKRFGVDIGEVIIWFEKP
jgi:hypothetical protein